MAVDRVLPRFFEDVVENAAALVTSRKWNQSEAAHHVAPVLDLEQRARRVGSCKVRKNKIVASDRLRMQHLGGGLFPQEFRRRQIRRQLRLELIAHDQV